jgi:hypothetical protein
MRSRDKLETTNLEPSMSKLLIAICIALPLLANAFGQSASELASKYPHHEVYEVQPGVQMAARFAANGLVCEMQIEQAHFVKDGIDLRSGIDKDRLDDLLDQLVPASQRGKRDPSGTMMNGAGNVDEKTDSYANVFVSVLSSPHGASVVKVVWRHRKC